ncbi:putative ribonuclease H-like domain-containing protein [Tanacetum coccineum]
MQDELLQFRLQKVWRLVDLPKGKHAIGTKVLFYMVLFKEEVYVCQPPGFEDPQFPDKVYKVEKALYWTHQAPKAWYADLLKTTSTPIKTNKALLKDKEAEDVDVHLYRSMIGSLMYLTASRPDIMFAVYACARFQVTPKVSHLHPVKRIFRYWKGQPKLGLWYPRDSPFDLEAFSNSDYAGASLDRKSTIGGCQFLGKRLISWQCKKQTIVANSTTEAEYGCLLLIWFVGSWFVTQNQMLDYGFNFMNTKIHIDNESTICIMKNPMFHSKTKNIEIRHLETDIREKEKKSSKNRQNQARSGKAWKSQSQIEAKVMIDGISDEFGVKTGSCKVNAARQDLVLLGEKGNADFHQIVDFLNASTIRYSLTISPTIYASYIEQFWATAKSKIVNNKTKIHAKVDGKTIVISESSVRRDDRVVRATTTASRLEAEQESGNIHKTQSTLTFNESPPQGTGSGSGPRCQDTTLRDADAQTSMEHQDDLTNFVPPTPHDSPLSGGHTPGSDEDCSRFSDQKAEKESQKIRKEATDKNSRDATLQDWAASASVTTVSVSISTAKPRTPPTTTKTAFKDEDLTIAQTLVKIRSQKDKEKGKGVAFRAVQEESARPTRILLTIDPKR